MDASEGRTIVHAQTESPLFGIPQELRDMIYKLVFQDRLVLSSLHRWRRPKQLPSGLLLICKQAFSESVEVYYKTATFQFLRLGDAFWWLGKKVPKAYAPFITNVSIWVDADDADVVFVGDDDKTINKFYSRHFTKMLRTYGIELKNVKVTVVKTRPDYDEWEEEGKWKEGEGEWEEGAWQAETSKEAESDSESNAGTATSWLKLRLGLPRAHAI